MVEWILWILLGVAVGCIGSLLGLGGGFILVPLFMLTMLDPVQGPFLSLQQIVGTSLLVVLANALSGTYAYTKQKRVLWKAGLIFAAASIPGALVGTWICTLVDTEGFSVMYGVLLVLMSSWMFIKTKSPKANASSQNYDVSKADINYTLGAGLSFFVGIISSLFGIGGGIIHVPMMVFLLGIPPQIAVATSTLVLFLTSSAGVVSHAWFGHVVWGIGLMIGVGAMIGAQIGAKIAKKSRPALLVQLLSLVMFGIGIQFVVRGFM